MLSVSEFSALGGTYCTNLAVPHSRRLQANDSNAAMIMFSVFILEKGWSEGQARLAGLSTNSLLIRANNSNHMIQIDEPGLVVDAVRRVHAAARNKAKLAHESWTDRGS